MAEGSPPIEERGVGRGSWAILPSLVLEKICSLMGLKDQISMSKVCKTWNEGYNAASICEIYKFALTDEDMSSANPWSMKDLVNQKAGKFKKVVIDYCLVTTEEQKIENWIKHFEVFLDILTRKSCLIEIHFFFLSNFFERIDTATYTNISRKIAIFMKSQHYLEHVKFINCLFKHDDALSIVENTIQNNFKHLGYLVLVEFVKLMSEDDGREQIFLDLVRLPMLKNLAIDYELVLGKYANPSEIKEAFKSFPKLQSLEIFLTVDEYATSFQRLGQSDWTDLNDQKKGLQIFNSVITQSVLRDQNEYIIVPHMPIRSIMLYFWRDSGGIGPFFAHALSCKANEHLVHLTLYGDLSIPDLASGLVPFLIASQKLQTLLLNLVYPVDGLDDVLETLIKIQGTSLKSFQLNISCVGSENNRSKLIELLSNYVINLKIEVNICL